MNRSRLTLGLALVVVLPVVVLGGCSDDPRPKVAPSSHTPSASVSESPSPSPSPWSGEDAVLAVRAWVQAQNEALRTGRTGRLRHLCASPCQACDDFIKPIERVYRFGGYFQTSGWKVAAAKARPRAHDPFVVNAGIHIGGGTTVIKKGADPVRYQPDDRILRFKLVAQDSRLLISFIGFLS